MGLDQSIKAFLAYLKSPRFHCDDTPNMDLTSIISLYFIVFVVEMALFIPISLAVGLDQIPHAMEDMLNNASLLHMFVLAVLVAPLLEELIFRYFLKYVSLIYFFMGITVVGISTWLLSLAFPGVLASMSIDQLRLALETNPMWIVPIVLAVIGLVLFLYRLEKAAQPHLIEKLFPVVFYVSVAVFALFHVGNFSLEPHQYFYAPLLVLPQFILGLYLGYLRMRKGLQYSIFIHALNNAIPILLVAISKLVAG